MANILVRNLPDPAHRALRVRAAQHGRSMEAEAREILQTAALSPARVKIGDVLTQIGQEVGLTDQEFAIFESVRDGSKARAASFE
jgi:plasmid stability protein